MPLNYTIDSTSRLVTLVGDYADSMGWKVLLSRVFHDPRRQDGSALLCKVRSVSRPLDAATVLIVIDTLQRFWPLLQPSQVAVLTPGDFDSSALNARTAERERQMPLRVFNSHESALGWLAATERRKQADRRTVWRGGRRATDWLNRPGDASKEPATPTTPSSEVTY